MEECEAKRKFRTILRQFDLDDQVKEIEFCENKLDCGALGTVEIVAECIINRRVGDFCET